MWRLGFGLHVIFIVLGLSIAAQPARFSLSSSIANDSPLVLKEDLSMAQQDLCHLSADVADVKAEKEAQMRVVCERSLKMEAKVRSIEALSAELAQMCVSLPNLKSLSNGVFVQ